MINRVFLSLGSNVNPKENLLTAIEHLNRIGTISRASSVWETKPIGYADQENFLNAVVLLETETTLDSLFDREIPQVEKNLGRVRGKNKYGPRSIDIDILTFNDFIGVYGTHYLPNREIIERSFVGIPLAEIAPGEIHPELGVSYRRIAARFTVQADEMERLEGFQLIAGG